MQLLMANVTVRKCIMLISQVIATGLYSGYAPKLSGTAGSLLALVAWYMLSIFGLTASPALEFLWIALLAIGGLLATRLFLTSFPNPNELSRAGVVPVGQEISCQNLTLRQPSGTNPGQNKSAKIDPGCVVIDEWLGMFVALWGTQSFETQRILAAFVIFRLFDIIKPGPVRWAEKLPREWGIMADDLLAGLFALGVCSAAWF